MSHFDWLRGFVFPYVNFLVFAVLLVKFAGKPLRELFGKRKREFQALVESAKETQNQARQQLAVLNERLAGLDKEVQDIKDAARRDAEDEARKIIEQGKKLATYMKEEAVRVAEAEISKARDDLQQEILVSVRQKVEEKIRQDMTSDEKKQFMQSQVSRLRAVTTRR